MVKDRELAAQAAYEGATAISLLAVGRERESLHQSYGLRWRYLPRSFPNWNTLYGLCRQWTASGVWQRINDFLWEQLWLETGRKHSHTEAIIDSQSPRTAEAGDPRG